MNPLKLNYINVFLNESKFYNQFYLLGPLSTFLSLTALKLTNWVQSISPAFLESLHIPKY